ncbi:DM13 domain-containing protein [Streptosporangium sp. NPDC023615]|uniref:DM13 domain-containing protein n=1 Tax=Streptosporangium sp. NPDC023615 TaxID=3154794 RepID=UPI003447DA66
MRVKRLLRHPVTWGVLAIGAVAVGVALYLFQPWRVFTVVEVNEALPVTGASSAPATSPGGGTGDGTGGEDGGTAGEDGGTGGEDGGTAGEDGGTGGPTGRTKPAEVSTRPKSLAGGTFVSHEHETTGKAEVLELADGSRILRIEDLNTSDGPDLRVWLSDQPVKRGRAGWFNLDDGRHLELGDLKGNRGDANYAIPAGADLDGLETVTIWCKRFSVSFGAAALR